ncbi:MAG: MarR family transcriptional regulator [Candidatus Woesearchaeota archaeon]|nr:MarR family transcriptional regulator [Candidatus Woesearchaeota archaeon]
MHTLPGWAMQDYSVLWVAFRKQEFSHDDVAKALGKDKNAVSVLLNRLKKDGWLTASLDPNDGRKRLYTLVSPRRAVMTLGGGKRA